MCGAYVNSYIHLCAVCQYECMCVCANILSKYTYTNTSTLPIYSTSWDNDMKGAYTYTTKNLVFT